MKTVPRNQCNFRLVLIIFMLEIHKVRFKKLPHKLNKCYICVALNTAIKKPRTENHLKLKQQKSKKMPTRAVMEEQGRLVPLLFGK
jgi:hypothetical protein